MHYSRSRCLGFWPSRSHAFLTREWPGIQATTLHISEEHATSVGELLLEQYQSADCSADVLHEQGARQVLHFKTTETGQDWLPKTEDTVLISGGTRGIGLSLAKRIADSGATLLLLGRSALSEDAKAFVAERSETVFFVQADVCDKKGLSEALQNVSRPTVFVHCAGVLADGPLESVDAEAGALARRVKVDGWLNVIASCRDTLNVAVGVGSWAGRFGNRHQAHYAAANALLSTLSEQDVPCRTTVVEYGPWTSSDMVKTIPAPIQAAMRAEGVDFVGNESGMERLLHAISTGAGPLVIGRRVPHSSEVTRWRVTLDTSIHPFLLDHAIDGTPILPLASATDLMAALRGPSPFEMSEIKLFQEYPVSEPTTLELTSSNGRSRNSVRGKG